MSSLLTAKLAHRFLFHCCPHLDGKVVIQLFSWLRYLCSEFYGMNSVDEGKMVKFAKSNTLFSLWKFNLAPKGFQNKEGKDTEQLLLTNSLHSLCPKASQGALRNMAGN